MPATRLLTPSADAAAFRAAIDTACGYPRRAAVIGAPDALPAAYSPGAPGWTAESSARIVSLGNGYSTVEVAEASRKYLGVTVGGFDIPAYQPALMIAGQSNARDIVIPDLYAQGWLPFRQAVGGTSLAVDWVVGGGLYNAVVNDCQGLSPGLVMFWGQGEADANNATWAAAYRVNLGAYFSALQTAVGPFKAHIAILHPNCIYPHTEVVRQAQLDFCASNPALYIPFHMTPWTANYDGLHFPGAYELIGTEVVTLAMSG